MEGNFYPGRVGSLWDGVVDVVFCLAVFLRSTERNH